MTMAIRRKRTSALFWICLVLIGLAAAVGGGITALLPAYLNSGAFYRIVGAAGLPDLEWKVRRVWPSGADIEKVRIGPAETPALLADAIRLDYSPAGLARRRLDHASITGLEVSCGFENGHFFIRGLDLKALAERFPTDGAPSAAAPERPPFIPETLEIRHSLIRFVWEKRVFCIPVDLRITAPPDPSRRFQARIDVVLFDAAITFDGDVDLASGRSQWRITAPGLSAARIVQAAGLLPEAAVSGAFDLTADAAFRIAPFVMDAIAVRIGSNRYRVQNGPITAGKPDGRPPAAIDITMADDGYWNIRISDLSLASPLPAVLSRLSARLSLIDGAMDGSGEAVLVFTPPDADPPDRDGVDSETAIAAGFSFGLSPSGEWRFTLSNQDHVNPSAPANVQLNMTRIHGVVPRLTISGEGRSTGGTVRAKIDAGTIRAATPGVDVQMKSLTLEGEARFDGWETARATLSLQAKEATVSTEKDKDRAVARLPSVAVSGNAAFSREEGFRFDGKANMEDGTVEIPGSRVKVGGVRLTLPLAWPWQASDGRGSCSFTSARWDGRNLGSLKGRLQPRPEGIRFDGNFFSRLLPGLSLKISGDCPFLSQGRPSVLSWSTRYRPAAPLDMGRFTPDAKGMTAEGTLKVDGRMSIGGGGAEGDMTASLSNGRIELKDKDIRIDDIRLDVNFPELPDLRSAPGQTLAVGGLTMGKIRLEDADIRFQIEPDTAVLVEKGRFKWCGGNVNAQSMRISPGMSDVDLILYCDRVNLAELLGQLGAAKAEGEGAVNGRIPVRLRKGKLEFDDGFLYSTPGDGGVIHVTSAQVLTAGIPRDTPQFAQIDLAVEALKSYEYAWAKLRINSEGENLRLKMQFDGKPTAPLPFVYKKDFGGFVRVDASHPGSNFQGIQLDVTLGLPLNKILQYKDLMEMFQ